MKLVSVNVGLHRDVIWHGRTVTTVISNQPVEGRVALRRLNLDGDCQAQTKPFTATSASAYKRRDEALLEPVGTILISS